MVPPGHGVTRIHNGTIWTGGRNSNRVSNAIAFDGEQILALGADAMDAAADIVIDAEGGFVCSAFRDGHVHPILGGSESMMAPVRDGDSPEQIARAAAVWAAAHPDAPWVRGEGFDQTVAPDGRFLAAWLDVEIPDRPVVLRASDYHTVWVNSEALRRVGYHRGTPQPHDGEIDRRPDGEPSGTLREWGAWRPVYDLLPARSASEAIQALDIACRGFAAAGITSIVDAWVEEADLDAWLSAEAAGVVRVRADLALWCDPNTWRDQLAWFRQAQLHVAHAAPGRLHAGAIKFFADGVIESGTGALLEPYCDCPHAHGLMNWQPDELAAAITAVDALGFDPHVHAIGDAAARMALDAIQSAIDANGPRERRPTIAHAQLVDTADLPRFFDLGVIANFEPYWAQYDACQRTLTAPRLGPLRTDRQYLMRTLLDTGAVVSFGSDWPVSTHEPLAGIQVAVTRTSVDDACDQPWVPEERLEVEHALAAYTSAVAHQVGDVRGGVLRPGARPDLVMLASDPRTIDPMGIHAIPVLGTWCDGVRTHGA